ncbi:hypothetical protein R3P38DRAFT_3191237 [Favolaschia claudopus]|uniref:Uncharacterized protein n=1 Tax=Favolaschia claudopus TaxID=2862362 RepID=A0AAW0BL47_9AGAR
MSSFLSDFEMRLPPSLPPYPFPHPLSLERAAARPPLVYPSTPICLGHHVLAFLLRTPPLKSSHRPQQRGWLALVPPFRVRPYGSRHRAMWVLYAGMLPLSSLPPLPLTLSSRYARQQVYVYPAALQRTRSVTLSEFSNSRWSDAQTLYW